MHKKQAEYLAEEEEVGRSEAGRGRQLLIRWVKRKEGSSLGGRQADNLLGKK
jgi:hypothetical protein